MANLKRALRAMPLVTGCYSYTAITPAAATTGSEVRARITGAASDRVGPQLHSLETRVLVGNIVENNAGSMVLQVPLGAMPNIAETIVPLQTRISLTPSDVVSLEQRKLDPVRTTILVGGLAAGVAAGVGLALRAGGGSEPGKGTEEPPPIIRIPIWRFRLHVP